MHVLKISFNNESKILGGGVNLLSQQLFADSLEDLLAKEEIEICIGSMTQFSYLGFHNANIAEFFKNKPADISIKEWQSKLSSLTLNKVHELIADSSVEFINKQLIIVMHKCTNKEIEEQELLHETAITDYFDYLSAELTHSAFFDKDGYHLAKYDKNALTITFKTQGYFIKRKSILGE